MEKKIQLAYLPFEKSLSEKIGLALSESGFEVTLVQEEIDPTTLVIVLLTPNVKSEELFSSFPWLKEQFALSSYKGFRLMPLIAFDPSKVDIEKAYEGEFGETMEEVFSGEFKPFGWDVTKKGVDSEFFRILEESYSE